MSTHENLCAMFKYIRLTQIEKSGAETIKSKSEWAGQKPVAWVGVGPRQMHTSQGIGTKRGLFFGLKMIFGVEKGLLRNQAIGTRCIDFR